jgi:amino acid adenylation domain-containing protein
MNDPLAVNATETFEETARHSASLSTRAGVALDIEDQKILWTAALSLCLRRYGAPETAALTVVNLGTEIVCGKFRIDLTFADSIRAGEWLEAVRRRLDGAAASDYESCSAPERVALLLGSDLATPEHVPVASNERLFAVDFSTGSVSLSAGRHPQQLNDDFPLQQMLRHWEQLARGLVNAPESPVGQLPVLTREEMDALTPPEKPTEPIANPRFAFELFDDQVALTPDAPAVTDGNETISYHELWVRTNRLAHHLRKLGVGPETIVGVFLERSIELVVAMIGLQKAGGAYLPIDPGYPRKRLENLISDSRVAFIVTSARFAEKLPRGNIRVVRLDSDAQTIAAMPVEKPVHGLKPGNMGFVFYTSGSTGQPKGVVMEHTVRGPFDRTRVETDTLATGERSLLKSAVGFTLIIREIYWPLQWGGHLVVVPHGSEGDSAFTVRTLRDQKVVGANFVPSMLSQIVDEPDFDQCTSLRLIYTVGESLSMELQRRLFARLPRVRLFVFYGCTEAAAATFRECRPDEPYGNRVVIGTPMANKKIYLLDRNFMPVPRGVAGEIHTGGSISRGYLHRADLTADRFVPNPFSKQPGDRFYRTGDLARMLEDGSLEFIGRADSQVQVRGVRVELGEVESAIIAHPAVKDAIVMADPRQQGPTRLIAYFTENKGQHVSIAELRSRLRDHLPEYMVPSSYTRLDAFPLNANGKVDRRNLPEPARESFDPDRQTVTPRNEAEVRLLGLWARVLQMDNLGVTDRFFDVGGDSIMATRLLALIKRELHVVLTLPDFYREPTIEATARILFGKRAGTGLKLFLPVSTEGTRRPIFMANTNPQFARFFGPDQPFYGMKHHWLDARYDFAQDIPTIARDYLSEMKTIQPRGPYTIVGFSMGGVFALEMARQLEDAGHEVSCLFLLDPMLPEDIDGDAKVSQASGWANRHRANLRSLPLRRKLAYLWVRSWVPFQLVQRYATKRHLNLWLGLGLNAVGFDVPLPLRAAVSAEYYRHILKSYRPKPLRSQPKVFLIADHTPSRLEMLRRLFPAGLELRILETDNHLDVLKEPQLSRWMSELKSDLAGDEQSPSAEAGTVEAFSGNDQASGARASEDYDRRPFLVVTNNAEQFSVWPVESDVPGGWTANGFRGNRQSCLSHIESIWRDQRPPSLR